MSDRMKQPLWVARRADAARRKAEHWEAEALRLEALYHQAMMAQCPWAYDEDGTPLPDDELEAAIRKLVQQRRQATA